MKKTIVTLFIAMIGFTFVEALGQNPNYFSPLSKNHSDVVGLTGPGLPLSRQTSPAAGSYRTRNPVNRVPRSTRRLNLNTNSSGNGVGLTSLFERRLNQYIMFEGEDGSPSRLPRRVVFAEEPIETERGNEENEYFGSQDWLDALNAKDHELDSLKVALEQAEESGTETDREEFAYRQALDRYVANLGNDLDEVRRLLDSIVLVEDESQKERKLKRLLDVVSEHQQFFDISHAQNIMSELEWQESAVKALNDQANYLKFAIEGALPHEADEVDGF